jgi:hypothetical protein
MSEQLGATPLQAQRIHAKLNGLGSTSDFGSQRYKTLTEAELAGAYNTAGTTGAFVDPRNPDQSLEDYYRSNQSLSGFHIGVPAAAGAGAAAAAYPPPVVNSQGGVIGVQPGSGASSNHILQQPPPPPQQQQQQLDYLASSSPANPGGEDAILPFAQGALLMEQQHQKTSTDTYLDVCRSFFPIWLLLLLPLLLVSLGDLSLTIYINGKFSENDSSTALSEWGSVKSRGVYSPHYLNAETFWCILFFVAQGYTILISILLIALESTVGRSGSLSNTKNLAFAALLLSFLGLALYTVPSVKWTYVIVTEYSVSAAFDNALIPAVVFALEWLAVVLWLITMIMAAVQLGMLRRKRYCSF